MTRLTLGVFLVLVPQAFWACAPRAAEPRQAPLSKTVKVAPLDHGPQVTAATGSAAPVAPAAPAPLTPATKELLARRASASPLDPAFGFAQLQQARLALSEERYGEARAAAEASWLHGATGEAMLIAGLAVLAQGDRKAAQDWFEAGLEQFKSLSLAPRSWIDLRGGSWRMDWAGPGYVLIGSEVVEQKTGKSRADFDVFAVAVSPNGRLYAHADQEYLHIWDDWTGRWTKVVTPAAKGYVQFSSDSSWLSAQAEDLVAVYATSDWSLVKSFPAQQRANVNDAPCRSAFSVDSPEIAYQSVVGEITIAGLVGRKAPVHVKVPESCSALRLTKARLTVAQGDFLHRFNRYGAKLGPRNIWGSKAVLPLPEGRFVHFTVDLTPDGSKWLVRALDGGVALLDARRQKVLWNQPGEETPRTLDETNLRLPEFLIKDGEYHVVAQDTGTWKVLPTFRGVPRAGLYSPVSVGSRVWFLDSSSRHWIWSNPEKDGPPSLKGPLVSPFGASGGPLLSPSGRWLAERGTSAVRIWDTASAKPLRRIDTNLSADTAFFFGRDDRYVGVCPGVYTKGREPQAWDIQSGSPVPFPIESQCRAAAGRGAMIALVRGAPERDLALFEETGKIRCNVKNPQFAGNLSIAPNGARFLYSEGEGIAVLDATNCKKLEELSSTALGARLYFPRFASDSTVLFNTKNTLYEWRIDAGSPPRPIAKVPNEMSHATLWGRDRIVVENNVGLSVYSTAADTSRFLGTLALPSVPNAELTTPPITEIWHPDGTIGLFGGELPNQLFCAIGPLIFPFDACRSRLKSQRGFDQP